MRVMAFVFAPAYVPFGSKPDDPGTSQGPVACPALSAAFRHATASLYPVATSFASPLPITSLHVAEGLLAQPGAAVPSIAAPAAIVAAARTLRLYLRMSPSSLDGLPRAVRGMSTRCSSDTIGT